MHHTANLSNKAKEKKFYLPEMVRLNHIQNFLQLIEEHDFLEAARFGPILEQALNHRLGQSRVLFNKLNHTIGQLQKIKSDSELVKSQSPITRREESNDIKKNVENKNIELKNIQRINSQIDFFLKL
ncbi:hypothetical protein BpHYR1_003059 [Brachionus plicatilis]|uniref:Uncharacterized protein n=1 Tax=Brachionus plicatilis TaxID=10195 RepID=A0A3M7SEC6_BRAPC|nr:hypothetical protein BpHYR1_003059 [Brachionus plicatilis]